MLDVSMSIDRLPRELTDDTHQSTQTWTWHQCWMATQIHSHHRKWGNWMGGSVTSELGPADQCGTAYGKTCSGFRCTNRRGNINSSDPFDPAWPFQHYLAHLTPSEPFDPAWSFWSRLTILTQFDHFDTIWPFWTRLTLLTPSDPFDPTWSFWPCRILLTPSFDPIWKEAVGSGTVTSFRVWTESGPSPVVCLSMFSIPLSNNRHLFQTRSWVTWRHRTSGTSLLTTYSMCSCLSSAYVQPESEWWCVVTAVSCMLALPSCWASAFITPAQSWQNTALDWPLHAAIWTNY